MDKLYSDLIKYIEDIKGSILGIGTFEPVILKAIEQNKNVVKCDILSNDNIRKSPKGKTITMNKIRKYFKKNSVDYIICNYEDIAEYMRYFIKDSVYITKNKIYLYAINKEGNKIDLKNKYGRYKASLEVKQYDNNFILIVNSNNVKNNWFKDKLYFIIDSFMYLVEILGDLIN